MAGEKHIETSLPLDKLKAETLRLICRDLGLPPSTKAEMITALRDAAVQSAAMKAPDVDMAIPDQSPPKQEPFEFSKLRFIVKLVTSPYGCYRDPGSAEYDSDEEDEEDYDAYDPWLKIYYVKIETKEGTRVGQFGYRVICASARWRDIWMSDTSGNNATYYNLPLRLQLSERGGDYLEGFGHALWNNNSNGDGNIKEEFVTGYRKGTGVFQRELNEGSLAVLSDDVRHAKDDLFIQEEFRGRGIGTWALKKLFQHHTLQDVDFIFAEPWATRVRQDGTDRDAVKAANDGVQSFFRKAGFRRVGQSEYFAYALANKNHPSHKLAIEDDADFKQ